jgi:hypothetical protein
VINLRSSTTRFILATALSLCLSSQLLADDVVTPDIQPDGQLSTTVPTPQPPLIEQQHKTHYELQPAESKDTTNKLDDESNSSTNQAVGNTPKPPLIDAQPQPAYEPEIGESPAGKKAITSSEQSAKKTPEQSTDAKTTTTATGIATPDKKEQQTNWTDIRPQRVSADWLQLTSGEWLRGRIIVMQKDILEFDSDELNNLEIKWKKVKYIKSVEPYSLRFDEHAPAVGVIEITQDKIHVITDYDDQTFNRSELLSIASGHETEISKWTSKITFSINARRGNTNQTDFSSRINARRRTILSRLLLEYLGNFTQVENAETINNHRLNVTYDIFITRDLFLTPMTAEFFRDPFQNIEQRANIGVAIGYTLIHTSESEWDVSGGPAYQETKFVSVQAGDSTKDATATLILSTKFDTEINSKVDMEGSYSLTLGDEKTGGYTHHMLLTIETEITDKLDFDVTGVWDRVKNPVKNQDGVIPVQDDFRILIGLGYDL